ncbi:MAG: alpha/beta hydrolase [Bacteroidetes bacterium]|nr:alpha/beta hydrolase [Bacteroidota bacterium]
MLYHTSKGSGSKVIIFIHGNSSDHTSWQEVLKYMPENEYTFLAVDLPGHGKSFRSKDPAGDYSLGGMVKHVKEFIKSNSVKPYILVANSLGANIVGEIAPDLPNCKGIMLLGSTAVGKGLTINEAILPNPNVGICFSETFTDEQLNNLIGDAAFSLSEPLKETVRKAFYATDPKVRSALGFSIMNNEYTDELANIEKTKLPLALVYGEQEKLCKIDAINVCGLKSWRNNPITIYNSSHFSQLDQPESFAKLVGEFAQDCFK